MIRVPRTLRFAAGARRSMRSLARTRAIHSAAALRASPAISNAIRSIPRNNHLLQTSNGRRHFSSSSSNGIELLQGKFAQCRAEGRPAFVAYLTAGFPTVEDTVASLKTMQDNGADVIEVGVPFTDPLADGPTIQRANQVALENGITSVKQCLDLVKEARAAGVTVPIVLMGYYNPLMQHQGDLMKDCQEANVSGFIVVDMPPEEAPVFRSKATAHGLSYIPLIAPTTTDARLDILTQCADSFIYAVSVTGVTGARKSMSSDLGGFVDRIKARTDVPIAVGFGIGDQASFRGVSQMADGVVVGSAIINNLTKTTDEGLPQVEKMESLAALCTDLCARENDTPTSASQRPLTHQGETKDVNKDLGYNQESMFGEFGGAYVPETLTHALDELATEYNKCKDDPEFLAEVDSYHEYIGRPSSFHMAERLTEMAGGANIWLKREDLNHTGAHKINNAIAQALLAKRIGKTRIIAETGAGQHGVATATICAKLGLPLTVYMGAEDVQRQMLNVFRMRLMGATVCPVDSGSRTLKDAINEAMRDWVTNIKDTHYLVGSAIGPYPFPTIVRDFQSVIGRETREQSLAQFGKLPDALVACVGGGSNAIGFFHPFMEDKDVRLVGVEAAGDGLDTARHSATLTAGKPGVLHGTRTYLLQDEQSGQIQGTHSISAGLDYPGVGPEHAHLKFSGRAEYIAVTDKEALRGFATFSRLEGIIPALETSHAISGALRTAATMPKGSNLVICVSGRGDKDLDSVTKALAKPEFADVREELKCQNEAFCLSGCRGECLPNTII